VQQEWLRDAFKKSFSIDNVIVSLPVQADNFKKTESVEKIETTKKAGLNERKNIFFYPATPMVHKNFEIICKAVSILEEKGINNFEVVLTLEGNENRYAKSVYNKYKSLKTLRFVGFLSREEVNYYYQNCDCLIFPSKIESWGLPVSEAKEYDKAVLVSNLPYAKETVGNYDKAKFFDPDDATKLAEIIKNLIDNSIVYDRTQAVKYREPFSRNWNELLQLLFPAK
jgi:glycosyltransferase involved in cell wall biosynthesis